MKKNVIALAVAAAMAAPLAAQAEVKVSGALQAEILSLSGDTVREGLYLTDAQEGGNPGSGNWGALAFSASEDLGNGMKALAKYSFNVDVDGKSPAQRDAYVGLSGGFGTIMAGTMNNPYKSATVSWDPFLTTSAQARGNYGMSKLHNGYVGNAIAYANKFGMAKVVAAIVLDEGVGIDADGNDNGETSGDHAMAFSVNVPVGPVEVAVAHLAMDDYGTNAEPDLVNGTPDVADDGNIFLDGTVYSETGDFSATKVGAKYAAGAMSFAAQMEMIDNGGVDVDHMYLNGTYTAGANTFAAAYGTQEVDGTDTTQSYMSLGMIHGFSKSTSAHIAYIALDHDGADDSGIAAGLRVKF